MKKLTISTEISEHSRKGVKQTDGSTKFSMIPKMHIGSAKDNEDNEYELSTSWSQDCLIIHKKGADTEYLISFQQLMDALEKAKLI